MELKNNVDEWKVTAHKDGYEAHLDYEINNGYLDIVHTFVPQEIEGQGVASKMVKLAYDFAREHDLKPKASCSYAKVWLERHPDYFA